MSKEALSCIVCNKQLRNVFDDAENQPSDGLAFRSYGHYGGTVFDPMDGRYLEVNVCDECLVKAANKNEVLLGQDSKLVVIPGPESLGGMPNVIGTTPIERALVPWNPDSEEETEYAWIESYEEYKDWKDSVHTRFSDDDIREMLESGE